MKHFDSPEFMWKDQESHTGNCPGLHAVDGGYIVQGEGIDDATRAQLQHLSPDEVALFVPANVLDRLRGL